MFASTEKVFVHIYKGKGCGSIAKRMSWCALPKKVVVAKRPISYGLCTYEHVFEGVSGDTVIFYTGTSLQTAFLGDKTHLACSKILKFIIILISTSKVTCYCDCFCFNKYDVPCTNPRTSFWNFYHNFG